MHIFSARIHKIQFRFGWGSARDPTGGAIERSPDPLAGGEGLDASPQEPPTPHSRPSGPRSCFCSSETSLKNPSNADRVTLVLRLE